jgi:CRISPR-associated endonuclease Cas3-HD
MMLLAHSARNANPPQAYKKHVLGVVESVCNNIKGISSFIEEKKRNDYLNIGLLAATYHDLGKIAKENQDVLCGNVKLQSLPIDHRDAGIKYLIGTSKEVPSATLIYAHHWPGLPNIMTEVTQADPFRFDNAISDSDQHLDEYMEQHKKEIASSDINITSVKFSTMEYRMLLSCLVDADYSDTAGEKLSGPEPRWNERLHALDSYIKKLRENLSDPNSERNKLRNEFYDFCRTTHTTESLEYCDSPVGTGKTTAVMAHMLKVASEKGLRHIFIVLPYTNIISQTVNILREALVLDGENPAKVVAEHHHQADFESIELRHLASTWTAPIIVTTAVQFFETIASNLPSKLRKLHQLPGSGIIIDESHASLPIHFMLPAWKWMNELTDKWGCNICMCSGTSSKFWTIPAFSKISHKSVMPLLPSELSAKLESFERDRLILNIDAKSIPHFIQVEDLVQFLERYQGSRLIVLNTVRSAAFLANYMRIHNYDVLHLSTALTPDDREKVITEVKRRLDPEQKYSNSWTLVATSCIECGMDFSFHYGFCELRYLQSYLQLGGRVSRNGEFNDGSLTCFTAAIDGFGYERSFGISIEVFKELISSSALTSISLTEAVTSAIDMECKKMGCLSDDICRCERNRAFKDVAKKFKVIDEDTVTVIADTYLIDKLKRNIDISANELQRGSVNLRRSVLKQLGLHKTELPCLTSEQYDDFLGYMKSLI